MSRIKNIVFKHIFKSQKLNFEKIETALLKKEMLVNHSV